MDSFLEGYLKMIRIVWVLKRLLGWRSWASRGCGRRLGIATFYEDGLVLFDMACWRTRAARGHVGGSGYTWMERCDLSLGLEGDFNGRSRPVDKR